MNSSDREINKSMSRELRQAAQSDYFHAYDFAYDVAVALTQLLEEQGLNKAQLAKRMGVSRAYITQVFSGHINITLKKLVEVCRALNTDPRQLLGATGEQAGGSSAPSTADHLATPTPSVLTDPEFQDWEPGKALPALSKAKYKVPTMAEDEAVRSLTFSSLPDPEPNQLPKPTLRKTAAPTATRGGRPAAGAECVQGFSLAS